jgi:hypothetical protein
MRLMSFDGAVIPSHKKEHNRLLGELAIAQGRVDLGGMRPEAGIDSVDHQHVTHPNCM